MPSQIVECLRGLKKVRAEEAAGTPALQMLDLEALEQQDSVARAPEPVAELDVLDRGLAVAFVEPAQA